METKLILLFVFFASQLSPLTLSFQIETLNEGEGLRFEEVGDFKLIRQFHELTFTVNLTDIETLFDSTEKLINDYRRDPFFQDETFQNDTKEILEHLNEQRRIYNDIFSNSSTNMEGRRVKRLSLLPTLNQDANLEDSIDLIKTHSDFASDKFNQLSHNFGVSTTDLNHTNVKLALVTYMNQLEISVDIITENVQSILNMQQRKRASSTLVAFNVLRRQKQLLEKLLGDGEELPYVNVNQYYYEPETTFRTKGKNLTLVMKIPFVEKTPRKLYKIHELPSYYKSTLLITDVEWKYLAVGEKDMVMMKNLDECLKGATPNLFLCNSQSPIMNLDDSSDCLIHAFISHEIDFTTCKTAAANFSQLIFIKLGNGEYFYFSPHANSSLNSTCNEKTEMKNLTTQTGILRIEQGCKVFTDRYELRSTRIIEHDEIKIHFHVGYIEGELLEILSNLTIKYYKEAMIFDEITKAREYLQEPDLITFGKTVDKSSMSDLMVIFACAIIIFFLVIIIRSYLLRQSANPKSFISKKREDIIVKIDEKNKPSTTKV